IRLIALSIDSRRRKQKAVRMRLLKQLEFAFQRSTIHPRAGRDVALETTAREILSAFGATRLADSVRVEWNTRLQTCAGRAHFSEKLISLYSRLCEYGVGDIDGKLCHTLRYLMFVLTTGIRLVPYHS